MSGQAAVDGVETGSTFHLTLCPVLQAAGGAAGDHEAQRAGEWPLPVSALWGGAGLPGQLVGVLQRLQEGKEGPALALLLWPPSLDQPYCCSVALHPGSQECMCVCTYICKCVVSYASLPEGQTAWLLGPALGSGPLGLTGPGVNTALALAIRLRKVGLICHASSSLSVK